ncbi:Uncharacterised protein [Slackia heliotrinireducens]|uniref:Uncharacterized protein n=1 Tax=Slackia heliotrinireducens (strain ATCC 29202 / DSM 20476 / NCTC 11029 / RHS 1) TaxID=471855 RepID=C7N686_SLAHD|nr:hypothetical protein [Slackia heliotrinireducens]ACV22421.1 hypothetical protein Shel_14000 [Slackia heliotrinireducens DSM 20476]VEH00755.1 Uncharacterised protein [Slackia heliotrinireducens]
MAGAIPTLFWFDRFDDRIGILPVIGELVHTEELNGEDILEFQTYEVPAKAIGCYGKTERLGTSTSWCALTSR